jgi:D-alanyl-D-alanine dipeptidase
MVQQVRSENPGWSEEEVQQRANRFSAPPDAVSPPPHITGGAIDVEIVDESGQRLDFTSPFELTDPRQAAPDAPGLSQTARENRALLRRVLEPTGLTNYVAEWWHWSYGDAGWALRVGAPHAIYDRIELPPDAHWLGDMSKLPRV